MSSEQRLNPHALHWKVKSQPLDHHGRPQLRSFKTLCRPHKTFSLQTASALFGVLFDNEHPTIRPELQGG